MSASTALPRSQSFVPSPAAAGWLPHSLNRSRRALESTQRFSAEQEIYAEGDDALHLYRVVSGTVRTCKFQADGRRQIDAFYLPGDIFGFEAGAEHGLCAEAVTDCTILIFRRHAAEGAIPDEDCAPLNLFSHAMHCLERSRAHALLLGRASASQKFASFLLEMTRRGSAGETLDLVMSRQDIADYLGLTIETVSRTVSQFERDGLITMSSARRIRLANRPMLRAMHG